MTKSSQTDVIHVIPRQLLQAEVLTRLRTEIIEGLWKPGIRLQERLLCERYGISRSPLREAYHVLATEGFLELLPNRGAIVTAPTLNDVLQNHVLLRTLEALGIELACKNATDAQLQQLLELHKDFKKLAKSDDMLAFMKLNNDIHRAIVCASGNQPLISIHLVTARHLIRLQNLNGSIEHSADESIEQHEAFMAPLLARQSKRAVSAFLKHTHTIEENLKNRINTSLS